MYITEQEIVNFKLAHNSTEWVSLMLKDIIETDQFSKDDMREGVRYYNGQHDVLQRDFRKETIEEVAEECDADGTTTERTVRKPFYNPNRSNEHTVNTFHSVLVDQKVSYLLGKEPTVSVYGAEDNADLKAYEDLITEWADEEFDEEMQDLLTGASNKGWEAMHFYYDEKTNELRHVIVPAETIVPVYDSTYQNNLEEVIRYYPVEFYDGKTKKTRMKVEWWTAQDVTYYIESAKEKGKYILDAEVEINPAPHYYTVTYIDGTPVRKEPHSWGRVPFVILRNNANTQTDLQPIKGLVDAYDIISSEGVNNFEDLVDLYWIIQGYGGEAASTIAKKLKINRAVSIQDASGAGSVTANQVDLPIDGRISFLNMLRRDIYHFGRGVDTDQDKFGNTPSGVALKFAYAQLDLKCNRVAAKLKKAIREYFWFITDDYNRQNGTEYNSDDIKIVLNKTMITNDLEIVQIINQSKGTVSDKTLLANHPMVDDVNAEMEELEAQNSKYEDDFISQYYPAKGSQGSDE